MTLRMDTAQRVRNRVYRTYVILYTDPVESLPLVHLAEEACTSVRALMEDILTVPDNQQVVDQLWEDYGRDVMLQAERDLANAALLRALMLDEETEDEDGDGDTSLADYHDQTAERRRLGLRSAMSFDAQHPDWQINFDRVGVVLVLQEADQVQWRVCRAGSSVASQHEGQREDLRQALQDLNPYLDRLEDAIDAYDQQAEQWTNSDAGGKGALEGLSKLDMAGVILRTHANQQPACGAIVDGLEAVQYHYGEKFAQELEAQVQGQTQALMDLFFDTGFVDALYEYLALWDPSDHYYWHTLVARSLGVPTEKRHRSERFDERLFTAIERAADLLSAHDSTAERVANEANEIFELIYEETGQARSSGQLGSNARRDALLDRARQSFSNAPAERSIITPFAVVSGWACTWAGNFEGPPSVLSLILLKFSQSERFLTIFEQPKLMKAFLLLGVSPDERTNMQRLLQSGRPGDIRTAQQLYQNGSWRSTTIYALYGLMSLVILVYHVKEIADDVASGATDDAAAERRMRQLLVITQDIANLCLVGLTYRYSRDLDAFLAANQSVTTAKLATHIHGLETQGGRVLAVRWLHRGMAFIGVILAGWEIYSNWGHSDNFERLMLAVTFGASLMCFLGTVLSVSWLGPVGFVIGVIAGIVIAAYHAFLTGIEQTLRALVDQFEDSAFGQRYINVETGDYDWVFMILPLPQTYGSLIGTVRDEIQGFSWDAPEEARMYNFYRAGLNRDALMAVYEMEESEVSRLVRRQRSAYRRAHPGPTFGPQTVQVQTLTPGGEVPWRVGIDVLIKVVVTRSPRVREILLHPQWQGDLNQYFAAPTGQGGDAYVPDENALRLTRERWNQDRGVFRGIARLLQRPPGNRAEFEVSVGEVVSGPTVEYAVVG